MRTSIRVLLFFACLSIAAISRAQEPSQLESYIRLHYTKQEHMIPMRDGVKLFTAVYVPQDTTKKYPILMKRTPYSCAPYGVDKYRRVARPQRALRQGRLHLRQPGRARAVHVGRRVRAGHAAPARTSRSRPTSTKAATPTTRSSGS